MGLTDLDHVLGEFFSFEFCKSHVKSAVLWPKSIDFG